jgi:murein DD-endopeptidase MepM/ murein hydrolase activator NlpD
VVRRAIALVVVLGLLVSGVVSGAAPASASKATDTAKQQRKDQIKKEIKSLREEVEEASAEESELLGKLDDVQATRAQLDEEVADLDGHIADVQTSVDEAAARFDALSAELVDAQLKLQIATDEERAARDQLAARAVEAYMSHPELSAAGLMMHASSLRAVAASQGYYKAIINQHRVALDRYKGLKEQTEQARQGVEVKRDAARAQQDVIVAERQKLEAVRSERDGVRQQVLAQEAQQEQVLSEIQARKAEFEAQIFALQAESNSITQLLQGFQSGQTPIPPGSGRLGTPIPGAPITSTFGPRMHPIFHEMRMHTGVDFGAKAGTLIHAAADGTVVSAGPRGGYGNATIIDHGSSLATLYAHQSALYVSAGQRVTRGQVIGAVGCTGYCTGPHLHFEVRVAGTPVDPLPYL